MSHSADLQWILVRQNSKFLQKRGGYRLSSDPLNNNSNWTKRQSGFLNDTAAVVKPGKGAIVLTVKDGKNNNKPKQMYTKKVQAAGVKASAVSKAAAEVRPDQADVTFRRARRMARIASREKKVREARKKLSSQKKFARKSVRPKRK